jgi:hypothetical protein
VTVSPVLEGFPFIFSLSLHNLLYTFFFTLIFSCHLVPSLCLDNFSTLFSCSCPYSYLSSSLPALHIAYLSPSFNLPSHKVPILLKMTIKGSRSTINYRVKPVIQIGFELGEINEVLVSSLKNYEVFLKCLTLIITKQS